MSASKNVSFKGEEGPLFYCPARQRFYRNIYYLESVEADAELTSVGAVRARQRKRARPLPSPDWKPKTHKEKRYAATAYLLAHHDHSNNSIAKMANVSSPLVATVRADLEHLVWIPRHSERVDGRGRKQSAKILTPADDTLRMVEPKSSKREGASDKLLGAGLTHAKQRLATRCAERDFSGVVRQLPKEAGDVVLHDGQVYTSSAYRRHVAREILTPDAFLEPTQKPLASRHYRRAA